MKRLLLLYLAAFLVGCVKPEGEPNELSLVGGLLVYVCAGLTMLLALDGSASRFAFTDRLPWWRVALLWLFWPLAPWLIKPKVRRRD
jgi:hypothetical protein